MLSWLNHNLSAPIEKAEKGRKRQRDRIKDRTILIAVEKGVTVAPKMQILRGSEEIELQIEPNTTRDPGKKLACQFESNLAPLFPELALNPLAIHRISNFYVHPTQFVHFIQEN